VIKDNKEYEKVMTEIYDLMQIPKLTKKQGKTLVALSKKVEIYELLLEIEDLRKKLNKVWDIIQELEKKGDSKKDREMINLIESKKKRYLMCRQFVDLDTQLQKLKKGGE
jgi:hypothetical protein